ncbi:MAG: VOC family protein [bacterium]
MLSLTPELLVEDIQKTLDWYQTTLGFEVMFVSPETGTPTFTRIKKEGTKIMFFRRAEFSSEILTFSFAPMGGSFVLYLEVKDIKKIWLEIQDKVTIVQPPQIKDYGSQEFTIQDFNGYHLMFGQRS